MIKKVKNWLGIEGVKVKLEVPETFSLKSNTLEGEFIITSLSDQVVKKVTIYLVEKYSRGRRKSKLIDEYLIGEKEYLLDKEVSKEQGLHQNFKMEFSRTKSPIETFGDKNPIYKGIYGLAKMIKNAKSKYFLIIEAEVTGNKLKPYDKVEIVPQ